MNDKLFKIGQKLVETGKLEISEYEYLIDNRNDEITEFLKNEAIKKRQGVYGNSVFIRGLIEISNICKNDCLYCGIRASNKECDRYRLTKDEILSCCDEGYSLGFRTFVMQGGEDGYYKYQKDPYGYQIANTNIKNKIKTYAGKNQPMRGEI